MAAERFAIIVADGAIPDRAMLDAAWPGWGEGADLVIAADGGARNALALGLSIDRWVGDADSIPAAQLVELEARGVPVDRLPTAKDASDTEVALLAALDRADGVILLGALGGDRVDHALANLGLLQHPAVGSGERVVLYDEHGARIMFLRADGAARATTLRGRIGDLVSLLPVGATAHGVTTENLQYPLVDEPLVLGSSRGLSNVRTANVARVTLRSGRLLVIETPVTVRR
jgi:thiamine pyrophosphokinase